MKNFSMIKRFDREAGQGSVEYLGVIAVAVVLVVALGLLAGNWASGIGGIVDSAIAEIGNIF